MIKASYVLWLIILSASIFGVFEIKYRVQDLRKDLAEINRQLDQEHDSIHVLNAEWSYLNQPDRLRAVALRHLDLQAVTVAQINPSLDNHMMIASAKKKEPSAITVAAAAAVAPAKTIPAKTDDINLASIEKDLTTMEKQPQKSLDKKSAHVIIHPTIVARANIPEDRPMRPILTSLQDDE